METTDGGKHWEDASDRRQRRPVPPQRHRGGQGCRAVHRRRAGQHVPLPDWGQTWEKLQGPYEGSLFGVIGTAQARPAGLRPARQSVRSSDFGSTWQQVELKAARGALEFGLSGATLLDDGDRDGRQRRQGAQQQRRRPDLQRVQPPDRISLSSVTAAGDGNLILVGQGGVHATQPNGAEINNKKAGL
jgi:photosystem II stability/assembly factor-like uncharacterized protein